MKTFNVTLWFAPRIRGLRSYCVRERALTTATRDAHYGQQLFVLIASLREASQPRLGSIGSLKGKGNLRGRRRGDLRTPV